MSPSPVRPAVRVGLVGCGTISDIYLKNATRRFANLDVVACADLVRERAEAQAAVYGIPHVMSVDELTASREIDVVLNLTIPAAHHEIARRSIEHGKSTYSEKPLATRPEEGSELVALAVAGNVLVGSAPDTFLGAGLQTCRRLLDDGAIGEVVGAAACFASHGNEHWHPNPAFSYQPGGGPVFNLGPYYLTALVSLLGPVRSVTGNSRISFPTRTISSQPLAGQVIPVETPTFVNACFTFAGGPVASFTATYDVWASERPKIEIYGSEGTLSVPDPNTFGGPVRLYRRETKAWEEIPLDPGFVDNARGLGLSDFALSMTEGRSPRASAGLANHVLELMTATESAGDHGGTIILATTCDRPAPLDPENIPLRQSS
ncbi:MAG: Gfo/Idh/MocA family oxidoreductase [Chloroflexia bacterium]|nr:Gfo/Idh/MocA family oxidoreductase [Chloroflexia bacterium]